MSFAVFVSLSYVVLYSYLLLLVVCFANICMLWNLTYELTMLKFLYYKHSLFALEWQLKQLLTSIILVESVLEEFSSVETSRKVFQNNSAKIVKDKKCPGIMIDYIFHFELFS